MTEGAPEPGEGPQGGNALVAVQRRVGIRTPEPGEGRNGETRCGEIKTKGRDEVALGMSHLLIQSHLRCPGCPVRLIG